MINRSNNYIMTETHNSLGGRARDMRNQEPIKNFLDGILKCGKQLEMMLTLRMAAFLIECGDSRFIPPI